jgi:hypothetical protein
MGERFNAAGRRLGERGSVANVLLFLSCKEVSWPLA